MQGLGILQAGTAILGQPARDFDLPADADSAAAVAEDLFAAIERVARVHPFAKGMGMAAPQIGIDHGDAVVRPADPVAPAIVLLNPRIIDESHNTDEQYEGLPELLRRARHGTPALHITVETSTLTGEVVTAAYHHGLARLIYDGPQRLRTRLAGCHVAPARSTRPRRDMSPNGRPLASGSHRFRSGNPALRALGRGDLVGLPPQLIPFHAYLHDGDNGETEGDEFTERQWPIGRGKSQRHGTAKGESDRDGLPEMAPQRPSGDRSADPSDDSDTDRY
jgi:peptide deformylase